MSARKVAARYAKALMDLAIEQDKLERIFQDVVSFNEVNENRDFALMMKSPLITASKKEQVFKVLFEGKYDPMTMAFLKILLNKGRERYLPEVADAFLEMYQKHQHVSSVILTTATELSAETVENIRQQLLKAAVTDEKVEIHTEIDPELLGGFVIEFDNKRYDASVKSKLDALKKEFVGNQYVSQIIA